MGGFGSGRRSSARGNRTVESSRALNLRLLEQHGVFASGQLTPWHWYRGEEFTASISIRCTGGGVILFYRYLNAKSERQRVEQHVRVVQTGCSYGGFRRWFVCPTPMCGRRVGALYWDPPGFSCRHCCHLIYQSQRERQGDRALRRARKMRLKLGGDVNMFLPFPVKPKGLHWRTYYRLRMKEAASHGQSLSEIARRLRLRTEP